MKNEKLIFFIIFISFLNLTGCTSERIDFNNDLELAAFTANISPEEAYELINKNFENPNFIIVDLRTEREIRQGYILNSLSIDFNSSDLNEIIDELDRKKTYLLYCASAIRSRRAMIIMREKGFYRVYNMSGGFNAWRRKGLPREK